MSNVKLQASASGTGTVTIAPPVTNSDLTINLPANSGTVPTIASVVNNGVVYTNSTGAITSSSALTFDGTKFTQTASTTGILSEFVNSSSANQNGNIVATNDGGTKVRLQVFGSAAGSYGMLSAGSPALYTSASELNFAVDNASGVIKFSTGSSVPEKMRLDSSGNLGIGTSSPSSAYSGAARVAMVAATSTNAASLRVSSANASAELYSAGASTEWGLYSASNSPFKIWTNNNVAATIDSSGNLGLGVTPSAWTSFTALQFGETGCVASNAFSSSNTQTFFGNNLYYDGAYRYIATGSAAAQYIQLGSEHRWNIAASGTAGNAISFTQAMTLDASGNLGINSTSPSTFGKVTVQVAGTTTPTNLTNVGPSSINLYAAANGGSTDSTMGIFGWNSTTGIGSGIGFVRENGSDWGTQIRFYTHPTTTSNIGDITERARITSGGNLCVGATSGNYRLNVVSASHSGIQVVTAGATTGLPSQDWYDSTNGTEATLTTGSGFIQFGAYTNHPLLLTTNNTERARITTGGDFVIGKTAASESYTTGNGYGFAAATTDPFFSIVNVNGSGANGCIYLNRRNVGSASLLIAFLSNNGSSQASVGSITHNGSNTAYNTASDYRLKYDIAPMTGALAKVALLKPCTYKWNVSGADGEGFIAHELAEVCPQAVTGEKDAVNKDGSISPQGIDTSYLVATLTAAIQELKAEFDAYKATHP